MGVLKGSWAVFLVVFILSGFLFFFRLGDRSLRNPDEGRYAEIAREMVIDGEWIEPHLYGADYLKKPPLFYWLIAASFKVFGFNELAARLVPAFFGVLGVLATFFFAKRILGLKTAFFSALILTSNFWYLQVGRYLLIDMVFSFFITAALYLFYLGVHETSLKKIYYLSFYICIGLAFLAKGIAGFIIPVLSIFFYLIFTRRFLKVFREMRLLWGVLIFLAIVGPWLFKIFSLEPEFIKVFVLHEHFGRFLSDNFEHQEPWYYYVMILPLILLPWTLFPWFFKRAFRFSKEEIRSDARLFLLISAASLFIFYSLSSSKLQTYMLPLVPLSAVFIGAAWHDRLEREGWSALSLRGAEIVLFLLLFAGISFIAISSKYDAYFSRKFTEGVLFYLQLIAAALMTGTVVCLRAIKRQSKEGFFYALIVMMCLVSVAFFSAMEKININYTTKHFAQTLKPQLKKDGAVFIYGQPGAFYDFAFYLDAPIRVVGLEGELELTRGDKEDAVVSVTREEFFRMIGEGWKIYCLIRKSDFVDLDPGIRRRLTVMKEDARKILFCANA